MSKPNRTRTTSSKASSKQADGERTARKGNQTKDPQASGTAAEEKLRAALQARPEVTCAELAQAAGIGRSTAGKILARWASQGLVSSTPGRPHDGGRRTPDRWSIGSNPKTTAGTVDAASTPEHEANSQTGKPRTDKRQANAGNPDTSSSRQPTPDGREKSAAPANTSTDHAAADDTADASGDSSVKQARLGRGGLRDLVEDHLRQHPGEQFSPSQLGKLLNRSAGAVNNALEKLVELGLATKTSPAPKRFTAADSNQASTTPAGKP